MQNTTKATSYPKILILEDDITFHEWLEQALSDEYNLFFAKTTAEASELLASNPTFSIVLVDEHLENERGSEWIKQHSESDTYSTSFVLYSGTETEESLVKSLACGASDFLVKPMPPTVLKMRIEKLIQYQANTKSYKNKIANQYNLIGESQNQAHLYSQYMEFSKKLRNCKTYPEIEKETLLFLNHVSLYGCLAIHEPSGETSYKNSAHGVCSPIEMQVMELLKGKEALNTIENRQCFYHPAVTLMIYNFPAGDGNALMMETIGATLELIGTTLTFIYSQKALLKIQELTNHSAAEARALIHSSKTLSAETAGQIISEINGSIHTLELSDEKQEFLRYIIDTTLNKYSLDNTKYNALMDTFEKTIDCAKKYLKN